MTALSRARPVFHSEADFQHALAWQIHDEHPDARIRLEYRPVPQDKVYLDLWIEMASCRVAIELKYLTRGLVIDVDGEHYELANQAAQNYRRHAFVRDIERLERVTEADTVTTGYAVLLTNDPSHWTNPHGGGQADAAFRVHERATLTGTLEWAQGAAESTKSALKPVRLRGSYFMSWHDYSYPAGGGKYSRFRYASVYVR